MTNKSVVPSANGRPTYVDVFAGCGGLSLGLERSGWQGLFAVEKDRFAFETLSANFLQAGSKFTYEWPAWLERCAWTVERLLSEHRRELFKLRGNVDLLAGGPPCQGFSSAGRRRPDDPRNTMIERYLELVDLLEPRLLLLENVRGFMQDFKAGAKAAKLVRENFAAQLTRRLSYRYEVQSTLLRASDFGVPQTRPRFILIGVRRGSGLPAAPLDDLASARDAVLARWGLRAGTSAREALSDLEIGRNELVRCADSPGFEAIGYREPLTPFQRAMRDGDDKPPTDTRLAKHTAQVRERFANIIEMCREQERSTRSLSPAMRDTLGLRKMATRVLDPSEPAPTVTSMPDDLLHYGEPRTLTVRENARLQTFPDWFVFKGKYTTGGHLRRVEVPRFTQVANAVPPLLAEILGERLRTYCLGSEPSEATPAICVSPALLAS
ncbi:DNA cytosine methyltransferase [Methylobacterium segetis]|uniref:DNA cytosine methyltransferase n=1 Tax=Methylobacterium segetis TaxID=2488750 RepID=UPI001053B2EF|nr:DNA cytosine methyltransferase [Methylobacterium segetis]